MSDDNSKNTIGCLVWAAILIVAGIFTYRGATTPAVHLPTLTPTPQYTFTKGNEIDAWLSFAEYYRLELIDCYFGTTEGVDNLPDIVTVIDRDFKGSGEYLGNGRWRFQVQVYTLNLTEGNGVPAYEQRAIELHSMPNNKWENICVGTTDLEDRRLQEEQDRIIEELAEDNKP